MDTDVLVLALFNKGFDTRFITNFTVTNFRQPRITRNHEVWIKREPDGWMRAGLIQIDDRDIVTRFLQDKNTYAAEIVERIIHAL
jgi:hypothetical protein